MSGAYFCIRFLSVAVTLGQKSDRYQDKKDCFQAITTADLQYNGKKIVGSAQLRRRHAVLQHGSIILNHLKLCYRNYSVAMDMMTTGILIIMVNHVTLIYMKYLTHVRRLSIWKKHCSMV